MVVYGLGAVDGGGRRNNKGRKKEENGDGIRESNCILRLYMFICFFKFFLGSGK